MLAFGPLFVTVYSLCLSWLYFVGLTGQQRDGDIKWTAFCNGWDSGPETAARGQRWFPTSTETVQFPATVRHPSFLFFLSSNCPCIHAAASTPLTYHVLPALSQPLHLTFFDFHQFLFLTFLPSPTSPLPHLSLWLPSKSITTKPLSTNLQTFKRFLANSLNEII